MAKQQHHFFATSFAAWRTSTPKCGLQALIKAMERDGFTFNLWLVPGPHDAEYEIENYAPKVEGAIPLGVFKLGK